MMFKYGYVAIVGRPNVGKSTLLNHLIGQKVSITSHRAQTTRHSILGIKTDSTHQTVYVDTPGLHQDGGRAINRYMNRAAATALHDVDIVVMVVDCMKWTAEDDHVLGLLQRTEAPVLLVVNKIDKLSKRGDLLPVLAQYASKYAFTDVVPVAAKHGRNLDRLEEVVNALLPEGAAQFADDDITDRSLRFLVAEIIREKLMRNLGQELPYASTVEIEQFEEATGLVRISAVIWVERKGQKAIVIGKQGARLKKVGEQARQDIEGLIENKVFLQLWVKVKTGWSDDDKALKSLGYEA